MLSFNFNRIYLIIGVLTSSILAFGQGHTHHHDGSEHSHSDAESISIPPQSKLVTGQGDFIFSWEENLTEAFPEDARPFEADMHGGFTEDPSSGTIYTGIPGYGLCSISSDLKVWRQIGTDDRLKDNI